ncbi:MAG TPA: hypothetical protein EYP40_01410, partial [Chromatiales bacterium]|nr:hypothetical protein [Chromatiales bacterium]
MSRQSDRRLGLLLGISAVLHLGLLGSPWQRAAPPLEFALQPPSLSVSLAAIEVAAVTPRTTPAAPHPAGKPLPPEPAHRDRTAPRPDNTHVSRAKPVAGMPVNIKYGVGIFLWLL